MQVLVSDTSVLIDIERASLTARLFELPYEFVVPDVLFEEELLDWIGPELVERGLRVEELTPNEVEQATRLRRERAMLSVPDVFAFALAAARDWTLLTGDGALREEAKSQRVRMHGVLWVFDQFEEHGTCATDDLKVGLTALRNHPRCRLPVREINVRLGRY
ncbi:hypothetical protein [Leisingera sp. M658]|uniref:hypothetical protein n=1 Tax=Leisingera sp. M658 TaxID=2867015 RepID=UPI0021A4B8EE|nr:hypothetical protein [Leisingera sp. M658]UWQ74348.1 hypothetical protein K3724_17935 [Leisingera sp. M658]